MNETKKRGGFLPKGVNINLLGVLHGKLTRGESDKFDYQMGFNLKAVRGQVSRTNNERNNSVDVDTPVFKGGLSETIAEGEQIKEGYVKLNAGIFKAELYEIGDKDEYERDQSVALGEMVQLTGSYVDDGHGNKDMNRDLLGKILKRQSKQDGGVTVVNKGNSIDIDSP